MKHRTYHTETDPRGEEPAMSPDEIADMLTFDATLTDSDVAKLHRLHCRLATVTAQRDELRRIADGFAVNTSHMIGRLEPDSSLLLELGQWAENLKSWRDHYNAMRGEDEE